MSIRVISLARILSAGVVLALSAVGLCSAQSTPSSNATSVTTVHPAGVVNGANLVFTLPEEPAAGSEVRVVLGGRELTADQEFSVDGRELTLAHSVVPSPGTSLTVSYHGLAKRTLSDQAPTYDQQNIRDISHQAWMEDLREEARQAQSSSRSTKAPALLPRTPRHSGNASFADLLQSRVTSSDEVSGRREQRLTGFEGFGAVGGLTGRSLRRTGSAAGSTEVASSRASRSRAFAMMQRRIDAADDTGVSSKKAER